MAAVVVRPPGNGLREVLPGAVTSAATPEACPANRATGQACDGLRALALRR